MKYILFITLVFFTLTIKASYKTDSLVATLKTRTKGEKITEYYKLAKELKSENIDSLAYIYFNLCVESSGKNNISYKIKSLVELSIIERLYFKNYDAAIYKIIEALKFDNDSVKIDIAYAHSELAEIYKDLKVPKLALTEKLIEFNLLIKYEPSYQLMYYVAESIASLYLYTNDFENAKSFFIKSLNIAIESNSDFRTAHAYNNIGFTYFKLNNPDSALIFYDKAISLAKSFSKDKKLETQLFGVIEGNIAKARIKKSEKNYVEDLLIDNLKIQLLHGSSNDVTVTKIDLANALIYLEKYSNAENLLDSVYLNHKSIDYLKQDIIRSFIRLYEKTNKPEKLSEYLRLYNAVSDSLIIIQKKQLMKTSEILVEYQVEKGKADLNLVQANYDNEKFKNSSIKFRALFIVAVLCLFIIVIVIWFRKRVEKIKLAKDRAEIKTSIVNEKNLNLTSELESKNKDLTDFAIDIARKNEFAKILLEKLKGLKTDDGEQRNKNLKDLSLYIKGQLDVNKRFDEFQKNIEEVNYEFFNKLTRFHPGLNQKDKQLCGFIRLNLTNKDVALINNISPKSAKMSRYRLKKKLNLREEDEIVDYLKSI